jgi:hypothetical protein
VLERQRSLLPAQYRARDCARRDPAVVPFAVFWEKERSFSFGIFELGRVERFAIGSWNERSNSQNSEKRSLRRGAVLVTSELLDKIE